MGPRRTTISFSSEDAPPLEDKHKVFTYYCKYSGLHALTTDCNLNTAPRRKTDHAFIVDTQKFTVRHYGVDGGVKLLRRRPGAIEKQYRINMGTLPFAYKTEPHGRYLYIMDDALTTYSLEEGIGATENKIPVPPCIVKTAGGTRVVIDLEDRAPRRRILKISADDVRIQIKSRIQNPGAVSEEIADFMRQLLGVRLSSVSVLRGDTLQQKVVEIADVEPEKVFERFQEAQGKRVANS